MGKLVLYLHGSLIVIDRSLEIFSLPEKKTLIARVPDPGWPACRLPVTCSPDDVRWITTDSNDK